MSLPLLPTASVDPREHELRMLAELVRLSRVTLLLAEAGSDKSEVVRSIVLPLLQDGRSGVRREVAVLVDWWEKLPLAVLNARIDEALARIFGSAAHAMGDAPSDSLRTRLAMRQQAFDCTFIIIFDRFEEYLAAPAERPDIDEFEAHFVEAVNSRTLRANFLLSLDEDAAPLLAPLRERVSGLGDAQVRLPKLDAERAAATDAPPPPSNDQLVGSPPAGQRKAQSSQTPRPDAAAASTVERVAAGHAGIGDTFRARREPALGSAGEPVGPLREAAVESREQAATATGADATTDVPTRPAETPSRSAWARASLMLASVLAVLALVLVLAPREAGEPPPDAAIVSPTTTPAQSDATSVREEQAQTGSSVLSADDKPVASDATPADDKPVASDPPPADEKPVAADAPPAQARTTDESPAAAASGTPLLFIHARSEAQRTYAVHLIEPLARHGIRVSGIRIESAGPPVSDLRYFRRADRAEARRINRALDVAGRPAERLSYIAGFEEPVPRRHYELWLPPPS